MNLPPVSLAGSPGQPLPLRNHPVVFELKLEYATLFYALFRFFVGGNRQLCTDSALDHLLNCYIVFKRSFSDINPLTHGDLTRRLGSRTIDLHLASGHRIGRERAALKESCGPQPFVEPDSLWQFAHIFSPTHPLQNSSIGVQRQDHATLP